MAKIQEWESALEKYLQSMTKRLFRWGKVDCVLFGCKWAGIATGVDPAEGSYGAYKTREEAFEHLKEVYGSIEEGLDKHFNRVPVARRQRGDLALCMVEEQETLGIVGANGFTFFKAAKKGIIATKNCTIKEVWRVA